MKSKMILLILTLLISISGVNGQEFKKDSRSQKEKEEENNLEFYRIDEISTIDLLRALEIDGIKIFKFPLKPFDKQYNMHIYIHEYVNGKTVREARNIYPVADNTYNFSEKNENNESIYYKDYIESLKFYTKTTDSSFMIRLETDALSIKNTRYIREKSRKQQFYNWRMYTKTDWVLNEEIPLLVYASSWFDEKYKIERFCGASDLSNDSEATKELLEFSPHYFMITYKIFE